MRAEAFTVRATWVPRGAFIREGLTLTVYAGPDVDAANDAVEFLHALAQWTTAPGALVVVDEAGGRDFAVQAGALHHPPLPRAPGYPAHACGRPMVPHDIAGQPRRADKTLFCIGCLRPVRASSQERLRATSAARDERLARSGGAS